MTTSLPHIVCISTIILTSNTRHGTASAEVLLSQSRHPMSAGCHLFWTSLAQSLCCAAERAGNLGVHPLPSWDPRSVLQQCMWARSHVQSGDGKCILTCCNAFTQLCKHSGRMTISYSVLQAHFIVDEMLMNGRIVETNKQNVLAPVQLLDKALWPKEPVQHIIAPTTASRSSKHVAAVPLGHVEIQFDCILEHRMHLPICLLSWMKPQFVTCKRKVTRQR